MDKISIFFLGSELKLCSNVTIMEPLIYYHLRVKIESNSFDQIRNPWNEMSGPQDCEFWGEIGNTNGIMFM